jgi:hypothetical protein
MMVRIAADVLRCYRTGSIPRYRKLTDLIAAWIRRSIVPK